MHYDDLRRVLADAIRCIKKDVIHLGKKCVDLQQSDACVDVMFEGGERAQTALVIGADGLHSRVRECLFGRDEVVFTGCVAWRGLLPSGRVSDSASPATATNWLGPGGHILHYPVRGGELLNFVGFVERDHWQIEWRTVEGTIDELANAFRGWHPDVHAIIRNIDVPRKRALLTRPPMKRWSKGRVALLGDACHPTLLFLGQGVVMALEDAYVVARCVQKCRGDYAAAFAKYEDVRRGRTAAVVQKSFEARKQAYDPALGDGSQAAGYVARDWQRRAAERYDWLYGYDATSIVL